MAIESVGNRGLDKAIATGFARCESDTDDRITRCGLSQKLQKHGGLTTTV